MASGVTGDPRASAARRAGAASRRGRGAATIPRLEEVAATAGGTVKTR